jgi:hypothetical protein
VDFIEPLIDWATVNSEPILAECALNALSNLTEIDCKLVIEKAMDNRIIQRLLLYIYSPEKDLNRLRENIINNICTRYKLGFSELKKPGNIDHLRLALLSKEGPHMQICQILNNDFIDLHGEITILLRQNIHTSMISLLLAKFELVIPKASPKPEDAKEVEVKKEEVKEVEALVELLLSTYNKLLIQCNDVEREDYFGKRQFESFMQLISKTKSKIYLLQILHIIANPSVKKFASPYVQNHIDEIINLTNGNDSEIRTIALEIYQENPIKFDISAIQDMRKLAF